MSQPPTITEQSGEGALPGKHAPVTVFLAAPRGFCAGVQRAVDAVRDAINVHGSPIYVRRAIVHNMAVVRSLESEGAVFVQELDEVPAGAVVVFSAHGVAPEVRRDAERRGLRAYDAVCPLVAKVHREVERHRRNGRHVVLIGHESHPEIEGTLGQIGGAAAVISSAGEVATLPIADDRPIAYAIQTTYSVEDAASIVLALEQRYSDLVGPATSDICYATTNRQAAIRNVAARSDAVIVVGEHFSSNATRLAEVAETHCASVQLVAAASDIDWSKLRHAKFIGITAAASTPEWSVQSVLDALGARLDLKVEEAETIREDTIFKRLAIA